MPSEYRLTPEFSVMPDRIVNYESVYVRDELSPRIRGNSADLSWKDGSRDLWKSAIKISRGGRCSKLSLIDVHDPLSCQSHLVTFLWKQLQ